MKLKPVLFKKWSTLVIAGVVFSYSTFDASEILAQVQQPRWYLDDTEVDFTKSTPQVNQSLPGYSPPTTITGYAEIFNGATNANGSLLFYTNTNEVWNKYGDNIGSLPYSDLDRFSTLPEVNIVSKPGNPCKHFILYSVRPELFPEEYKHIWVEVDLTADDGKGEVVNDGFFTTSTEWTNVAISKPRNQGSLFYMYYFDNGLKRKEITSTGISSSATSLNVDLSSLPYNTPTELELSHDQSMLVYTSGEAGNQSNDDVIVVHLDANGDVQQWAGNHTLGGISTYNVSSASNRMTGVEFSPNGEYIYVGQRNVGIYQIELSTGQSNIMSNSSAYGSSQLELGYNESGDHVIYASNLSDLGAIMFPNTSGAIFNDEFIENAPSKAEREGTYFLPDQIDGYDYTEHYQSVSPECCKAMEYHVLEYETEPEAATWSPGSGNNPFLTPGDLVIGEELRVTSGTDLTLDNMVIKFAEQAKIVVEDGARLTIDGSLLTTSDDCEAGAFWRGIEVWGVSNIGQHSNQGKIILKNNTVIENADMAVRLWNPSDWNSTGGIIDASSTSSSTFRNCRKSIEFMSYNAAESTSKIKWCTFEITDNYPDTDQPLMGQITLWDIKGVEISSNTFKNENTYFLNQQSASLYAGIGVGIGSIDAKYTAIANSFKGFYKGIDIEDYTALTGTRIQSNTFEECIIGVYAHSADYSLINGNYFIENRITGSYMETAVGFELHGNTYNDHNEFGSGSPFVSRGMSFNSLGAQGNGFNKNTFDNGNYGVYVYGPNQGLTFNCNDFKDNQYYDVIGFGYSGNPVFTQLGSASEPLANYFTYPCTHTKSHISLNGGAHPGFAANYYHHEITTEPRIEPSCVNAVSVHQGLEEYGQGTCGITEIGFDPSFSQGESPSHTDERIDEIGGVIDDNVTLLAEMKDTASGIIDNNNTQSLLNFISDGSNTSAQVAGEVADVAPYASEEVLSACLYRDPQMEANDLFDVLVWNSPLPYGVLSDSADIYQQLGQTLYDSLWDMQSGNSPVDSLNAAVQYRQAELDRSVNLMVVTLLHDTFVVNGAEQAFSHIRKYAASDQILMPLLSAAWQTENWNVADSTLGVMEGIALYEHVYDILDDINTEIGDSNKPYLLYVNDNDFKNKVDALAADSTKYGHQVARGIVTLFTDTIFPVYFPEVEMPETGKRNIAEQEEGDRPETDGLQPQKVESIKIIPNPAETSVRVLGGDIRDDRTTYSIMGIDGRLVKTGRLNNNREINISELSSGIFMMIIETDQDRYTHKLVVK